MLNIRHGLLAAAAVLSACAQAPNRPIEAAQRDTIKSADVVGVVPQKELDAQIIVANSSAATAQFGLIGALVGAAIDSGVNAHRASAAEDAVRPLRDALLGYDFDAQLKQDLEHELAPVAWLGVKTASISKDEGDKAFRAVFTTQAGSVLFVQTVYQMTPDFSRLHVAAQPMLLPKAPPAKENESAQRHNDRIRDATSQSNALYYNSITLDTSLESPGKSEDNLAKWAENNGDRLRRALKFQVTELAKLIAQDLQRVPAKGTDGETVENTEQVVVLRKKDGTLGGTVSLASLPALAPAIATIPAAAPAAATATATPATDAPATATPAAATTPAAPAAAPAATAPAATPATATAAPAASR